MLEAAITYAEAGLRRWHNWPMEELVARRYSWPWDEEWWKPSEDPVRNLVKAGALIAAEIDRLQRVDGGEGD